MSRVLDIHLRQQVLLYNIKKDPQRFHILVQALHGLMMFGSLDNMELLIQALQVFRFPKLSLGISILVRYIRLCKSSMLCHDQVRVQEVYLIISMFHNYLVLAL